MCLLLVQVRYVVAPCRGAAQQPLSVDIRNIRPLFYGHPYIPYIRVRPSLLIKLPPHRHTISNNKDNNKHDSRDPLPRANVHRPRAFITCYGGVLLRTRAHTTMTEIGPNPPFAASR